MRTCARADVPPFPYVGNGWTDRSEIWCVVGDPLAKLFGNVYGGTQLHMHISETAGQIALKFGCG